MQIYIHSQPRAVALASHRFGKGFFEMLTIRPNVALKSGDERCDETCRVCVEAHCHFFVFVFMFFCLYLSGTQMRRTHISLAASLPLIF